MDADTGLLEPAKREKGDNPVVDSLAIFLLGAGASWSAGNIGPVVADVSAEFDISLASVGVLSGTILFTSMVAGLLAAPRIAEALGLTRALALCAALGGAGNLLFAASGSFAVAASGRVLAGIGLGLVGGLAPVLARLTGGVGRVGLFGASFQLGIGLGLGVGSALAGAGADWRIGFVITAVVALSAIPFVLSEHVPAQRREPQKGFIPAAARSPQAWRLSLLFMAMFAVPLTLGAWFVHYVTVDGDLSAGLGGALAFVLFGVSGLMREVGGKLAGRGISQPLLTGAAPILATIGLVLLGIDITSGAVAVAVVLMGAGFALPYATMMIEAQKLWPIEPARPTSLLTMLGTGVAIPIVPVLGSILDKGDGDIAFIALGLFVLLAAALNVKPAGVPLVAPAPAAAAQAS
jgi:predicted MFS family arabinose efflux permease